MALMKGSRARDLVLMSIDEDVRQGLIQIDPSLGNRALRKQLLDRAFPDFEAVPPDVDPAARNCEDRLLARAKDWMAQADEACFFFATWAEHFVNRLIVVFCRRSGAGVGEAERLIRLGSSTLKKKATQVLQALNGEGLDPSVVADLQRLSEYRNDIAHYKWKAISSEQEAERRSALARVPTIAAHLQDYEERHVFRNQRARIREVLRDRNEGGVIDWDGFVADCKLTP